MGRGPAKTPIYVRVTYLPYILLVVIVSRAVTYLLCCSSAPRRPCPRLRGKHLVYRMIHDTSISNIMQLLSSCLGMVELTRMRRRRMKEEDADEEDEQLRDDDDDDFPLTQPLV